MSVARSAEADRDQRSLKGFRVTLVFKEPARLQPREGRLLCCVCSASRLGWKRFRDGES